METIIFLSALFTVSLGNAVPRHPNEDLIAKAIQPQHPNADLIHQAEQQNANGRIIGGENVYDASKYPWQASLRYRGSHSCGAAIISDTWLVTAAHCVGSPKSFYSILVGSVDRYDDENERSVQQIIMHKDYGVGEGSFPNDIAVIKVSGLPLSDTVMAVNLDTGDKDFAGNSDCHITGWGYTTTGSGSSLPTILQEANVNVYTNTECKNTWVSNINDGHVCIGDSTNGRGSCNGDSGGPLTCKDDGKHVLVGVTSWGIRNCYTSYPSVYTRISHFREWIREKTDV